MSLAALAPSGSAVAAEPLRMAPSSPWHLDYAEDSCRLMRTFGSGADSGMVYFERYGPGDPFNLVVAAKALRSVDEAFTLQVQFGDQEEVQEPDFFVGEFGDFGPALIFSSMSIRRPGSFGLKGKQLEQYFEAREKDPLPPIGAERERAVSWLSISRGKRHYVIFDLGSIAQPFAAMRSCTDNLLKQWGIDVARHATLSREPKPVNSPGTWVTANDYPYKMLRAGQRGIVHFRMIVDETGKPESCHIQQSTRPKEFDDVVCKRLMERARFEPALDAEGLPLRSYYRNSVKFDVIS
ncbi:TonB family protein [Allopontixanthobacter sp.]|uniref:energy transducer TonB n=1 Tax=Allopontixanthobacter sp. TaxID=2906452 RepID=UPI002AC96E57|nr:TonB family protein [Allopontixanthobacter sp.]